MATQMMNLFLSEDVLPECVVEQTLLFILCHLYYFVLFNMLVVQQRFWETPDHQSWRLVLKLIVGCGGW